MVGESVDCALLCDTGGSAVGRKGLFHLMESVMPLYTKLTDVKMNK